MCGIVGYIGPQEAAPLILGGLRQLDQAYGSGRHQRAKPPPGHQKLGGQELEVLV